MHLATFACPLCDVMKVGEVLVRVESIRVYRRPAVPMWPGGPAVEDPAAPVEVVEVDRLLHTNVCAHTFLWSSWEWVVHTSPELSDLVVTARSGPAPDLV